MATNRNFLSSIFLRTPLWRAVFSLGYVALLLLTTWTLFPIHYETNDDMAMAYGVAGYMTGELTTGTAFTNPLWGILLKGLYAISGQIPWYTIIFLALLFVSCSCILYTFATLAHRFSLGMFLPTFLYTVLHISTILYYSSRLQFTVEATLCGTAAGLLLLSDILTGSEEEGRERLPIGKLLLFTLLLFLSLLIRTESGYMTMALLGGVCLASGIVVRWKNTGIADHKKWIAFACAGVVAVGMPLVASTFFYATQPDWEAYRTFNTARAFYKDFAVSPTYEDAPMLYASVEWSPELKTAVDQWFLMDERITTEAFNVINAYSDPAGTLDLGSLLMLLFSTLRAQPTLGLSILSLSILALAGAVIFLFQARVAKSVCQHIGKWVLCGCITFALPLGFWVASLAFLYMGRYPLRIASSLLLILLPCVMIFFMFALQSLPPRRRRLSIGCCSAIVALASLLSGYTTIDTLRITDKPLAHSVHLRQMAEKYSIDNPNGLYIYDVTLGSLHIGAFTTYPDKKPTNLIFYGGALYQSPLYRGQLKANGLNHLHADQFFDENIYFLSRKDTIIEGQGYYQLLVQDYNAAGIRIVDDIEGEILVFQFIE